VFIDVGSRGVVPLIPGLDMVNYLDNESILQLAILPRHLIILGGSYIALEFAQIYRRFGSEVTVVEKTSGLASREDKDVLNTIQNLLEAEGIAVRLGASATRRVGMTEAQARLSGRQVLIGRRPMTQVARAIEKGETHGFIKVLVDAATRRLIGAAIWGQEETKSCIASWI
jgi:pyruvate/2-oxoglutarate dehydrogenase complex dihydrolipoamide dehydrogenase (E3) component